MSWWKLIFSLQDPTIDLKDKSVAVIGSGASSIQVVPSIQPVAKKVDVYVRSPTYILPTVGFGVESSSFNEPCEYSIAKTGLEAYEVCKIRNRRLRGSRPTCPTTKNSGNA